ncbi:MAG: helix-turn-helix transcriptional regulator [Cycloclasticus sp.]|nr:MAG: helix-turn-helix transcriptional regulator [Cycloclasticus sp.]
MRRIVIYSDNQILVKLWSHALISHFDILTASSTADFDATAVVVIDSNKIDANSNLLTLFSNKSIRFLIVGKDWSENKQINALVHGAAGYCGESEPPKLLLQAINSILKGDIWIQRHLVPRVIGTLVRMKSEAVSPVKINKSIESTALLDTLSTRERDVANMIRKGENNKHIATALDISERTVKAHLTSVFKKLGVPDRLHLAMYIKEYS